MSDENNPEKSEINCSRHAIVLLPLEHHVLMNNGAKEGFSSGLYFSPEAINAMRLDYESSEDAAKEVLLKNLSDLTCGSAFSIVHRNSQFNEYLGGLSYLGDIQ